MTARLPTPGADNGTWGTILNDFLEVSLTPDGTLNPNTVGQDQLQTASVGTTQLQAGAVTTTTIANNAVTSTQLASAIQTNLSLASSSVQSVNSQTPSGSGAVTLTASELGALSTTNNLSDVSSTSSALANLGGAKALIDSGSSITTSGTILHQASERVDATSGAITRTAPAIVTGPPWDSTFLVKKIDTSSNVITISYPNTAGTTSTETLIGTNQAKAFRQTSGLGYEVEVDSNPLGLLNTAGVLLDAGSQVFNVKSGIFGARGDGVTDDTAAIQSAINAAAAAVGGVVVLPPGTYLISAPLAYSNTTSTTEYPAPSLIGLGGIAGRIGDISTDISGVTIVASSSFPQGRYMVEWLNTTITSQGAVGGAILSNFSLVGSGKGAGLRIGPARRCRISGIDVSSVATPTAPPITLSGINYGAIVLDAHQSGPAAYNVVTNCCVDSAPIAAYQATDYGADKFIACFALSPGDYGYYCSAYTQFDACHCEESGLSDYCFSATLNISVSEATFYAQPKASSVIVTGKNLGNGPSNVKFSGCMFWGASATASAMVVANYTSGNVDLLFEGCTFQATADTTAFFQANANVVGTVAFLGCKFSGTPTVAPYILNGFTGLTIRACVGLAAISGSQAAPTMPASGTVFANPFPFDVSVYIAGGTVTAIAINGIATGLTGGPVNLSAGQSIALTYSVAPTWTWFGK